MELRAQGIGLAPALARQGPLAVRTGPLGRVAGMGMAEQVELDGAGHGPRIACSEA